MRTRRKVFVPIAPNAPTATERPAPTSEVGLLNVPDFVGEPDFVSEIKSLPAQLLTGLPLAVSLWLDVPGAPVPVCFTTAQVTTDADTVLGPQIVFDRDEVAAIVLGVEADRLWRKELLGACFEKWRKPARRISLVEALSGAMPDDAEQAWTIGRVLQRLGAELVRVELPSDDHNHDSGRKRQARARRGYRVAA